MDIFNILKLARKTFLTKHRRVYYSQFGEDAILENMIGRKKSGIYVDVGCYHPKRFSNTYLLHKRGWSGINIDMEENKIFCFRLARPNDFNVVAAISCDKQQVTIYRDREFSLGATINPTMGERMCVGGKVERLTIETRTLNDIIESSPYYDTFIDVLSIDCEGNDFSVLKSIDLKRYQPKIIIIEDQLKDIQKICIGETYQYLIKSGYVLRSWAHLSLIFVMIGSEFDNS